MRLLHIDSSVLGEASASRELSAAIVKAVFGTTDVPEIATTSPTAPGVVRRWTNMTVFADEVADARVWAGFHYRFSARVGTEMGYQIGEYVAKNILQPVTTASR